MTLLDQTLQHHRNGQFSKAAEGYLELLQQHPHDTNLHCYLAQAYNSLGRTNEAILACQQALALDPNLPLAHHILGCALAMQGNFQAAYQQFTQSLQFAPDFLPAQLNLAHALKEMGMYPQASEAYQAALAIQNDLTEAWVQLGHIKQLLGKPEEAILDFKRALAIDPHCIQAVDYWTSLLMDLNRTNEANQLVQQALTLPLQNPQQLVKLGKLLERWKYAQEAISLFEKALAKAPENREAHLLIAKNYLAQSQPQQALQHYSRVLQSGQNDSIRVRMATALPRIYQSNEEIRFWRERFLHEVTQLQGEALVFENPVHEIGAVSFFLAYHGQNNIQHQQALAKLFKPLEQQVEKTKPFNRKPKIGFVSEFFTPSHTIGKVFLGLIDSLSRDLFDITLFTVNQVNPPHCKQAITHIPLTTSSIPHAANTILQQNLDILCYTDIGMNPLTYYLGLSRLAPVQCVTWGHPDTTGMPHMDYYLSTALFEPPDAVAHYSEKLVVLQNVPTFYQKTGLPQAPCHKSDFGFSESDHLYLCLQSLFKFHPDMDAVIGGILRLDPHAKFVMANASYTHWTQLLLQRFKTTLPDVAERIVILDKLPYERFLQLLRLGDVMVDTIHFGGGSTLYEAFAMETPVVTLPTSFMRGRMAMGLLQKMEMTEGIAHSVENLVEKAVQIATEADYRQHLQKQIQAGQHTLFQNRAAVSEIEQVFQSWLP